MKYLAYAALATLNLSVSDCVLSMYDPSASIVAFEHIHKKLERGSNPNVVQAIYQYRELFHTDNIKLTPHTYDAYLSLPVACRERVRRIDGNRYESVACLPMISVVPNSSWINHLMPVQKRALFKIIAYAINPVKPKVYGQYTNDSTLFECLHLLCQRLQHASTAGHEYHWITKRDSFALQARCLRLGWSAEVDLVAANNISDIAIACNSVSAIVDRIYWSMMDFVTGVLTEDGFVDQQQKMMHIFSTLDIKANNETYICGAHRRWLRFCQSHYNLADRDLRLRLRFAIDCESQFVEPFVEDASIDQLTAYMSCLDISDNKPLVSSQTVESVQLVREPKAHAERVTPALTTKKHKTIAETFMQKLCDASSTRDELIRLSNESFLEEHSKSIDRAGVARYFCERAALDLATNAVCSRSDNMNNAVLFYAEALRWATSSWDKAIVNHDAAENFARYGMKILMEDFVGAAPSVASSKKGKKSPKVAKTHHADSDEFIKALLLAIQYGYDRGKVRNMLFAEANKRFIAKTACELSNMQRKAKEFLMRSETPSDIDLIVSSNWKAISLFGIAVNQFGVSADQVNEVIANQAVKCIQAASNASKPVALCVANILLGGYLLDQLDTEYFLPENAPLDICKSYVSVMNMLRHISREQTFDRMLMTSNQMRYVVHNHDRIAPKTKHRMREKAINSGYAGLVRSVMSNVKSEMVCSYADAHDQSSASQLAYAINERFGPFINGVVKQYAEEYNDLVAKDTMLCWLLDTKNESDQFADINVAFNQGVYDGLPVAVQILKMGSLMDSYDAVLCDIGKWGIGDAAKEARSCELLVKVLENELKSYRDVYGDTVWVSKKPYTNEALRNLSIIGKKNPHALCEAGHRFRTGTGIFDANKKLALFLYLSACAFGDAESKDVRHAMECELGMKWDGDGVICIPRYLT